MRGLVAEMKSLTGERIAGASMASVCAIERKLALTGKPHCIVLAWIVIDVLDAPATDINQLPIVMYSHHVVAHSSGRLCQGDTVLTSFATYYDPQGIFETADTVYILLHQGFRKSARLSTVRST